MDKKLNIGAGKDIKEGWDNQDICNLPGINLCFDLDSKDWPIKDNTYDLVECKMIIEHLKDWPKAMEEIWRISKQHSKIIIEVPLFPSMYAVIDPTHKAFFTYQTFEYFSPDYSLNYYTKARFNIKKRYIRFSWNKFLNLWAIPINMFPVYYSRYWAGVCPSNSLEIELECVK